MLLAQFSYALYFVLFKNFVNKYSLITIMKWMFTYAFICALPFSYNDLLHTEWKSLQNTEIGALVFIVVGSTFISYVLIVIGQKNLRPTVAGMYNYVQPLVASIVAVCWGMDTFNFVKEIKEKVDPRKWVCVGVAEENVLVVNRGDIVMLVMDDELAQTIKDNFLNLE